MNTTLTRARDFGLGVLTGIAIEVLAGAWLANVRRRAFMRLEKEAVQRAWNKYRGKYCPCPECTALREMSTPDKVET